MRSLETKDDRIFHFDVIKKCNKLSLYFISLYFPRYRPVFECVTLFLNKADQQNSRAAAILYLGAAEEFMRHFKALG